MNIVKKITNLLLKNGYSIVKLKKVRTGHFICKVLVNEINGKFILDTGASHTCIGLEYEKYFCLLSESSDELAASASDENIQTKQSSENFFEIGSIKKKQNFVLISLQTVNSALSKQKVKPVHGIIGSDFLEKTKAVIDYEKKNIVLKALTLFSHYHPLVNRLATQVIL